MMSSSSTPLLDSSPSPPPLYKERFGDLCTRASPMRDLADVFMRQAELPSDYGDKPSHMEHLAKVVLDGGKIQSGNQLSEFERYAEPRMQVNKKTRIRVTADLRPQIASALKAARKGLGISQSALAEALGSSQGAITRWEREIDSPPLSVFPLLARLVPEEQRSLWLELAGAPPGEDLSGDMRPIPVLCDPAAAGTARVIDESEVDYTLLFPRRLLPPGGSLVGMKIEGKSMSPVLEDGFIVLVDTSQREMSKLVGKMVAARDGAGVTVKWLRRQGKHYLLVPQNTSPRHEVRVITEGEDVAIVGEVVKWIGEPSSDKKRK